MDNIVNEKFMNDKELENGAKQFEMFWLRPKKMANKESVLRMKLNTKWGGWRLKDELVTSLGLEVGDTINSEVSVLNAPGLIDETGKTDLFASGKGADWLLENNIGQGSIIDAKVRFVYAKAPVGGRDGKEVWKLSLVFVEGYNIVKERTLENEQNDTDKMTFNMLKSLLED